MYEQWPAAACRWSRSGTCRHGVGRSRFAANSSNRCTQLIAKSASLSCPCTHHTLCVQCIACVPCIMHARSTNIAGTTDKRDDFCASDCRALTATRPAVHSEPPDAQRWPSPAACGCICAGTRHWLRCYSRCCRSRRRRPAATATRPKHQMRLMPP